MLTLTSIEDRIRILMNRIRDEYGDEVFHYIVEDTVKGISSGKYSCSHHTINDWLETIRVSNNIRWPNTMTLCNVIWSHLNKKVKK